MGLKADRSPSLDANQIANLLRSIMTPETIILVWASHKLDLRLLRELIAPAGYDDFLPHDDNCITMVTLIRKKLRQKQASDNRSRSKKPTEDSIVTLPLSLPIIFPLIFPGHELIGRNHRARVDALQLRLMAQYFENNCRSTETRNGTLFNYRRVTQAKIDDYKDSTNPAFIDRSLS
jgi:hypothetical protein